VSVGWPTCASPPAFPFIGSAGGKNVTGLLEYGIQL
jgi:hypothetical protein